jgi:type IV pilus assembly protein PilN
MIKINLLPVKRSKKRDAATRELAIGGVVAGVVLICLYVWYAVMDSKISAQETMIRKSQAEIARIEQDIVKVDEFKKKKRELEQKLEVIDELKAKKIGPVKLLDELAINLPKRAWLTSFEEKNGSMIMEGGAADNDSLSEFLSYLTKRSKFFSGVTLIFSETTTPPAQTPGVKENLGPKQPYVSFKLNGSASYGTVAVKDKDGKEPGK